jgi:hypothetical protein
MPWSVLRLAHARNGEVVAVGAYSEAAARFLELSGFQRPMDFKGTDHYLPASMPVPEQQMRIAGAESLLASLPVRSLARDWLTFGEIVEAIPEARTLKDLAVIADQLTECDSNPVTAFCHFADELARRISELVPDDSAHKAVELIKIVENDVVDAISTVSGLPEMLLHRQESPSVGDAPTAGPHQIQSRPPVPPSAPANPGSVDRRR